MKFDRHQVTELRQKIESFFEKDPNGTLEVARAEEGHTDDQQALIHIVMRQIAIQSGVHPEIFKQEYIKRDSKGIFPYWPQIEWADKETGEVICTPKSEGKLGKKKESEIIERLYALGAEWGVEFEVAA